MSNNFNELQAAETFLLVANTGSFAAAAKLKGENPSSVSRAVAQLEAHLSARLFNRTTRQIKITEAGEIYRQHARRMVEARQLARDAIAQLQSGLPKGVVRISLPVVVGERILANHLPAFHAKYPEVELQVDLSNRNALLVEEGLDLALRVGPLSDSTLRAKKIATIWRKMYAAPSYLQKHGEPLSPADLVNHQCIAFAQRGEAKDWEFWPKHGKGPSQKHRVTHWLTCSSPMMVVKAIHAGLGVGRSAPWMIQNELANGDLVEILKDWYCDNPAHGGLPMFIVFPPGLTSQVPLKTRVVAEFLEALVKKEFSSVS
ncbi:LysR substrate-binding domain-containing protein [Limnobacter sp.]|uniref:LysR family transcriptional regulator n=1 Tax=Limnobacter sp. TaxID=2003368 RepID=UPI0035184D09